MSSQLSSTVYKNIEGKKGTFWLWLFGKIDFFEYLIKKAKVITLAYLRYDVYTDQLVSEQQYIRQYMLAKKGELYT